MHTVFPCVCFLVFDTVKSKLRVMHHTAPCWPGPADRLTRVCLSLQVRRRLHHHPAGGGSRPRPAARHGLHRAPAARQHLEGEASQHVAVPAAHLAHLAGPHLLPAVQPQGGAAHRGLLRLSDHPGPGPLLLN